MAGESPRARGMFGRVRESLFPSRRAPVHSTTQAGQVRDRKYGGNTRAMATAYGVSPRTVQRWIDGTRHPTKHLKQLQREVVDVQTTERGRERKARQLEQRGPVSGVQARVGRTVSFTIRGSDTVRARDVHLDLSGQQVAALARAADENGIREVIGQALADYFNGGSGYGEFSGEDFDFDTNDFDLR